MAVHDHDNPARNAIAERIESLATELLVRGEEAAAEGWAETLRTIAREAATAGGVAVAAVASELAAAAEDTQGAAVSAGIARLQAALESWDTASRAQSAVAWETDAGGLVADPELLSDFIVEAREHLDSVEARLLEIERDPTDRDAIHSIFRSFHTVKGLAGFLELKGVRDVAHEVETVLDLVRESRLAMTAAVVDVVLASLDYLNTCVRALEASGPAAEFSDPAALLLRVRAAAAVSEPAAEAAPERPETDAEPAASAAVAGGKQAAKNGAARARAVKIDTDKLDYLVDMVGEMVIAQSLIQYDPDLHLERQPRLARNLSQLARITGEVQRTTMAMRMVPIAGVFQKMARLVRDLARKFGRQVEFESFGGDVELDRNIVEELADPLMHMIRNALDHGVEPPEERAAAGKNPSARVRLRAMHQAGQIVIEVSDDGRGLDRQKILAKARSQGLVTGNSELSDSEICNLIFQPGFSTAVQLSDVSGRGVGMDVVRKQITKLRGSIEIHSKPGAGTMFSLKLPLTLAIIDGLVVGVGEHRYVIPIFSVRELLRPSAEAVSTVENRAEMLLIRDRLVPIVRLYQKFAVEARATRPEDAVLVLAEFDGRSFCLMVDTVIGKQEIVIKSLGSMFQKVAGVAGGAILGDGHVALILDPPALFGKGSER
ncbi:MAG TPA: chemotaxis protein CheA [Bryobacteraceae bacterium]|nr:chemotaxis protein CheA [Bryobacteraceae bacterium]